MYEDVAAAGVLSMAVGVVMPDPASVESVLAWANRLQDRVEYVIVENATSALADFTYWRSTKQANRFREAFAPAVLQMEFRQAELENPLRQHGIQLGQVTDRKTVVDESKRASLIMRAQSYRRRTSAQKELTTALHNQSDSRGGVVAQVEYANNRLEYSLENRAKTMDTLLHEWKSDLLRIWIPMIAGAAMLIGLLGGIEIQGCRDAVSTAAGTPMQTVVPTVPTSKPQGNRAQPPHSAKKQNRHS